MAALLCSCGWVQEKEMDAQGLLYRGTFIERFLLVGDTRDLTRAKSEDASPG